MRNRDLRPAAKANPTIQQAFERFQKYNRLKNLSQGSLDFYAAKGRSFFRFLGDTEQPIHTITEETVEDYIFYMKDQQLHDTTINTNLRMVRAFLYWCMEKGYLEKYPIRLVRADDPIKEPYTTDELQKLLKEPDCKTCSFAEYRNWVIVNFLLGTGCRASTLLNLQIGDLDLSAGTVFFRHMKARNQQIVPLSKALVKIMEEYLEHRTSDPTACKERLEGEVEKIQKYQLGPVEAYRKWFDDRKARKAYLHQPETVEILKKAIQSFWTHGKVNTAGGNVRPCRLP